MKTSTLKKARMALTLPLVFMCSSAAFAANGDLCGTNYVQKCDGTSANPYLISDKADLEAFAGKTSSWVELVADIDMNPGKQVLNEAGGLFDDAQALDRWTPIKSFNGHFDGRNHTIKGLFYYDVTSDYAGLFGTVLSNGVVQNVGIIDSYFKGKDYVGGVAGKNEGTISGVYNTGSVIGENYVGGVAGAIGFTYNSSNGAGKDSYIKEAKIINSYNKGVVSGTYYVGGVLGQSGIYLNDVLTRITEFSVQIFIDNVYNTGAVSGTSYVGGVLGENNISTYIVDYAKDAKNEFEAAFGEAINGVLTSSTSKININNVYSTGTVSGTSYVGGVFGENIKDVTVSRKNVSSSSIIDIKDVYNTGSVNGTNDYIGGVVGKNESIYLSNAHNTGTVNGSSYVGGVVGESKYGEIKDVYNTGNVNASGNNFGGVIGAENTTIAKKGFYNIDKCPACKGAINGVDDKKNFVMGLSTSEFALQGIAYNIVFFDSDGKTVLKDDFVGYHETPVPPAVELVKEDDDFYYSNPSWTPAITPANGIAYYTLVWEKAPKGVEITVSMAENEAVSVLTPSPCVNAQVTGVQIGAEGEELPGDYILTGGKSYTATVKVSLSTNSNCSADSYVTKANNAGLNILVNGNMTGAVLSKEITTATITYESAINATIAFLDANGDELETQSVAPGETPEPPTVKVSADHDNYHYFFVGWNPEIVPVTENATYTAMVDSSLIRLDITMKINDDAPVTIEVPHECITATLTSLKRWNGSTAYESVDLGTELESNVSYKIAAKFSVNTSDKSCTEDAYVKAIMASQEGVKVYVNGSDKQVALSQSNNYTASVTIETKSATIEYIDIAVTMLDGKPIEIKSPSKCLIPSISAIKGIRKTENGGILKPIEGGGRTKPTILLPDDNLDADYEYEITFTYTIKTQASTVSTACQNDPYTRAISKSIINSRRFLPARVFVNEKQVEVVEVDIELSSSSTTEIGRSSSSIKPILSSSSKKPRLSSSSINPRLSSSSTITIPVYKFTATPSYLILFTQGTAKNRELLQYSYVAPGEKPVPPAVNTPEDNENYRYYAIWDPTICMAMKNQAYQYQGVATVARKYSNTDFIITAYGGEALSAPTNECFTSSVRKIVDNTKTKTIYDSQSPTDYAFTADDEYTIEMNVAANTESECQQNSAISAFLNYGILDIYANGELKGQITSKQKDLTFEVSVTAIARTDYGAITIASDLSAAVINGTSKSEIVAMNDIEVDGPVVLKRNFAESSTGNSAFSTLMLPFTPNSKPEGVTFYSFDGVTQNEKGKWTVKMKLADNVVANTPYLVQVTDNASSILFTDGGKFSTIEDAPTNADGNWKFVGTYEYKSWQEGDPGIGKTYGFAGSTGNDPDIVGKFAKVGAGAYIYPMRAYLEYSAPAQVGRPAANGETRTVASLPNEIDVVIVEKDETTGEQTTRVIGTLNTRTGEFKAAADRYFDMKGRFLGNKKPTAKGTYYNNGKKVIVK